MHEHECGQETLMAAQLALEYAWSRMPGAAERAAEALTGALVEGDLEAAGVAVSAGAFVLATEGRMAEALDYLRACQERMELVFGPVPAPASLLCREGTILVQLGIYDRGIERLLAAERSTSDSSTRATALMNLANAYAEIGEYPESIAAHKEAISMLDTLGEMARADAVRANLGWTLGAGGQDEVAVPLLEQVIERARKVGDRVVLTNACSSLAASLMRMQRAEEALAAHRAALAPLEGSSFDLLRAQAVVDYARALIQCGRPEDGLAELEAAFGPDGGSLPLPLRAHCSHARALAWEGLGNWRAATEAWHAFLDSGEEQARAHGLVATKQVELEQQKGLVLHLEGRLRERAESLSRAQQATITMLAHLAEERDSQTGLHVQRTARFVALLCAGLVDRGWEAGRMRLYESTSVLHDIGKVGVPDAILLKRGPLDPAERSVMEEHVAKGLKVLDSVPWETMVLPFAESAREIIGAHHERWDGTGYPRSIGGEAIPLGGRIMALADVYDALRSERPYKAGLPHRETVALIQAQSGRHFDPLVVRVFLEREALFDMAFAQQGH